MVWPTAEPSQDQQGVNELRHQPNWFARFRQILSVIFADCWVVGQNLLFFVWSQTQRHVPPAWEASWALTRRPRGRSSRRGIKPAAGRPHSEFSARSTPPSFRRHETCPPKRLRGSCTEPSSHCLYLAWQLEVSRPSIIIPLPRNKSSNFTWILKILF